MSAIVWRERAELAGRFRLQGPRLRTDDGAAERVERLGSANVATDYHHGRRVDRKVLWRELYPFRPDQALGADGRGVSQARGVPRKAEPGRAPGYTPALSK